MGHIERAYLKKGSTVPLLSASDAAEAETYRIGNVEGEDGYTVCYQAEKDGHKGKLIEFYPMDSPNAPVPIFFHMNRYKGWELKPVSDAAGYRFSEMKERFCRSYRLLSEQAAKSRLCNKSFYDFVPPYKLYYCGASVQNASHSRAANAGRMSGTAYIWMPETQKRRCFEDYLKDLQKAPGKFTMQKAAGIISTVIFITECIEYMHCAGLLHLDIRPSNFEMDYDGNFQAGHGHISMNAASAFFAPGNEYPISKGTGIHTAPEIGILPPDNRADIYSIGVMLHHAFMGQADEISGTGRLMDKFRYNKNLFSELCGSPLIRDMEADAGHKFASYISRILYRCLPVRREDRYASCESLLSDLKSAFAYVR